MGDIPVALRSRLRRAAPLWLVLGALATVGVVGPRFPREREVTYQLGRSAPDVTRLDVTWTAEGAAEPTVAATWHFVAGKAPATLRHRAPLADAAYDVDVLLERAAPLPTLDTRRRVRVEASSLSVPLESAADAAR